MTTEAPTEYSPDDFMDIMPSPAKALGRIRWSYGKITNKNPKGGDKYPPGTIVISRREADGSYVDTTVETILGVVLFTTATNKFVGQVNGKWTTLCQSSNGYEPDARITKPFCVGSTRDQVAERLRKYKLPEAKIQGLVPTIFEDSTCVKCGPKGANGQVYRTCPKADNDLQKKCRAERAVFIYDLGTQSVVKFDLHGMSIRRGRDYTAPIFSVIAMAHSANVAPFHFMHVVTPSLGLNGIHVLDFVDSKRIDDPQMLVELRQKATEVKEAHENSGLFVPERKEAGSPDAGSSQG